MRARFAFAGAAILAAALAACGGGGGGGGGGNPIPTPTQTATSPPTQNVTLAANPTSAPFPGNSSGITGAVNLPAGTGSAIISISTSPPNGIVAVQARRMGQPQVAAGGNTAVLYVSFTATTALTMTGIPGFTATAPAAPPAGAYFEGYYDDPAIASPQPQTAAWVSTTQTGQTTTALSFAATSSPTITLAKGQSLYLSVYYGSYIPPINILGCVGVSQARPYTGRPMLSHPIGNGDLYSYTGTLAQSILQSQPCPQPAATANAQVTDTISVSGTGSNITETSTEVDAYSTNSTQLTTTANVSSTTASGSTKYFESAENATDGFGDSVTTTYSSPLQFAQSPSQLGNGWTGSVPATVNQTAADGTTYNRTYNADGSYSETDTIPGGNGSNIIKTSANGSGSYEVGHGTPSDGVVTFTAPVGGTITASIGGHTFPIPSWLPAGFTLYSDVTSDLGQVTLPGTCTSPVTNATSYEQIERKVSQIDPVLGTIETETVDTYDANVSTGGSIGPVCSNVTDTLTQYYDWGLTTNGDFIQQVFFSLNAQPLTVTTLTESLTLGTGYMANARGRDAQARAFDAQLTARLSGIRFVRAMQRAQAVEAASRALRSYHGGRS